MTSGNIRKEHGNAKQKRKRAPPATTHPSARYVTASRTMLRPSYHSNASSAPPRQEHAGAPPSSRLASWSASSPPRIIFLIVLWRVDHPHDGPARWPTAQQAYEHHGGCRPCVTTSATAPSRRATSLRSSASASQASRTLPRGHASGSRPTPSAWRLHGRERPRASSRKGYVSVNYLVNMVRNELHVGLQERHSPEPWPASWRPATQQLQRRLQQAPQPDAMGSANELAAQPLAATAHITMHGPAELVGQAAPYAPTTATTAPTRRPRRSKAEKAMQATRSARHTARPSPTTTARSWMRISTYQAAREEQPEVLGRAAPTSASPTGTTSASSPATRSTGSPSRTIQQVDHLGAVDQAPEVLPYGTQTTHQTSTSSTSSRST